MASDDEVDEVTNGGTTDEDYRSKYLSTAVAMWIIASYTVLVLGRAFGVTTTPLNGGTWATYTLAFLAVMAYTFGPSMVEQAAKARG